jgi:excinuclease ABC subunit C
MIVPRGTIKRTIRNMSPKIDISGIVKKLPQKPGVYQFYNIGGEIIYIGKAKNLRKRVFSYFKTSEIRNYKQEALVKKIADIRYILVENESEALLLENNLIKEYQPRYNILLKDDKTFPWICIKNERFPRVSLTRNYIIDGSTYFGPYTSGLMARTLLELIRQLFKLRTCKLVLSETNISKGRFKRCLEYHLGNCKAPCEGLQDESDYNLAIIQIREILKGNYRYVVKHLHQLMENYSKELLFEEAEIVKHKIEILERFKGKSTIVNSKISDVDVLSIIDDEDFAFINFLKIVNGAIVQAHNVEAVKRLAEDKNEIFDSIIFDLRNRFNSNAKEVIVPFMPDISIKNVRFTVPLKGDKKKLLELSFRNAISFKTDKLASRDVDKWADKETKLLEKIREDLRLKSIPMHIECFDNSNVQGFDAVASCVVFMAGKPQKSSYRHFIIKSVTGPNDFASMEEIVLRRYKRVLNEGGAIPDLIIIDGGKGQLNAALKSLKILNLYGKISIIGIAKRLEEIYVPEDSIPLYLDKNSSTLRLIQKVRDEAHRFGITFHRNKRSKSQLQSVFKNIPGIGEKAINKILRTESDIERLKSMNLEDLTLTLGKRAAGILYKYLLNISSKKE